MRRNINRIESDDSGEESQKNKPVDEKPSDNDKAEESTTKPRGQTKEQCASGPSTSAQEAFLPGYSVNGLLKNDDNAVPTSPSVIRPTPTVAKPVAMAPTAPVGSAFSQVRHFNHMQEAKS